MQGDDALRSIGPYADYECPYGQIHHKGMRTAEYLPEDGLHDLNVSSGDDIHGISDVDIAKVGSSSTSCIGWRRSCLRSRRHPATLYGYAWQERFGQLCSR